MVDDTMMGALALRCQPAFSMAMGAAMHGRAPYTSNTASPLTAAKSQSRSTADSNKRSTATARQPGVAAHKPSPGRDDSEGATGGKVAAGPVACDSVEWPTREELGNLCPSGFRKLPFALSGLSLPPMLRSCCMVVFLLKLLLTTDLAGSSPLACNSKACATMPSCCAAERCCTIFWYNGTP